ncbi:heavy metal sensor kinase [Acidovorax sp. CF316]|uniref:heavy metal sensor histidine kinase n=1 Tax=Acidovorax sp. CF316 TaxID=1144317 RepID=UPI00026BCBA7|nr:heavy metal sensor histidine kinase [Acidovorax sp. CF316]EJE51313.1 heavy metal sensor kinase [Acidovorax sp. CF316]
MTHGALVLPPPRSLRSRLSWWLAVQSLAGLGAVCLVVYLVTAAGFGARQDDALRQKEGILRHLLAGEEGHPGATAQGRHALDDFLAGHENFRLQVTTTDGQRMYPTAPGAAPLAASRELRFEVARAAGAPLQVLLRIDVQPDQALLHRLAITLALAALAGTVVVSLGGFVLVHLGLAPVRQMAAQTRELSARTLHQRLDGTGQPAELQPLVGQFNALLGRLEKAYAQMEGFNADVAHELCTPLATLLANNELALRSLGRGGREASEAGEVAEVLSSNLEELQRLTGIVSDMLFLSQADRGARARRAPVASLAAVAAQVADYHEAALQEAGLALQVVGDAAGDFDVPLLHRALSNLIGNATRYALHGSMVRVCIARLPDGAVELVVENLGPRVEPEVLARLFDRFYRADPARSHSQANHGLGLAITDAIARMHGGRTLATSVGGVTRIGLELASG